jgi:hypothetical protein
MQSIPCPLRHLHLPLPILLLLCLVRTRNLARRILRPPKLDHDLRAQLSMIDYHRCKPHHESEHGMRHQEIESVLDMDLPCLTPHDAEDDGEELEADAIEESCA